MRRLTRTLGLACLLLSLPAVTAVAQSEATQTEAIQTDKIKIATTKENGTTSAASNAKATEADAPKSAENKKEQASEPTIDVNRSASANKRFVPSEKISKDLSVSFPVDI